MQQMFPRHDDNLGCFIRARQDGTCQSVILGTNAMGGTPHLLLASSWYPTIVEALEDLTFVMHQRSSQRRGNQSPDREDWLQSVRADWLMTQEINNLRGSNASAEA